MPEIKPREQCPACAAKGLDTDEDNLAVYEDGKYCQSCGYIEEINTITKYSDLIAGIVQEANDRGLSITTCEKYNIRTTLYTGRLNGIDVIKEPVRIFPYYHNGKVVKQKIKSILSKKKQTQKGNTQIKVLFGQQLFTPSDKIPIIVTEGEEDAAALWQMAQTSKYELPVVSIPDGANSAAKILGLHLEWLSGFKEVLLAFDNDDPGRQAFNESVVLFEPGKVKKVNFPLKDANEMLLAGRVDEVKKCLWNAEIIKPATIVFPYEIKERVLKKPDYGMPYPWISMTKATYGCRPGEVILLAGPTGSGKTEIMMAIISFWIDNGCKVGNFSFEQRPEQTLQRKIGAEMNERLHIPGCKGWDENIISQQIDKLGDKLALYQPESGHITLENIIVNIRYLTKAHNMRFFVIDNLKAMATHPSIDGKRVPVHEYASHCMTQFVMIAKQLNITIFVINHLAEDKISKQAYISTSPKNPEEYLNRTSEDMQAYINKPGMDWETGRIPTITNIFGGGAIKDLTDYIIVVARNRMSVDDDEHRTIIVKFLKTRLDSRYEGFIFKLKYNYQTGKLEEVKEIQNDDNEVENETI